MEENKKNFYEETPQGGQVNNGSIKAIRTYMSDMAESVRENDASVIKVAMAEHAKHEKDEVYKKIEGTTSKKIFWFIGGIIFIAGSIFGVSYLMKQKAKIDIPAPVVTNESFISYDEMKKIEVTDPTNFLNTIIVNQKDKVSIAKVGYIKYIYPFSYVNSIETPLGIKNIFDDLSFTASSSFVRSLSDSYMIGVYIKNSGNDTSTTDGNPKPFLILETNNYDFTYAGMLEWEKTMANDMFYMMGLDKWGDISTISSLKFKDTIIDNNDARVLYNESGIPILYYMFLDKDKLIITNSQDAIKEIENRLVIKNIRTN